MSVELERIDQIQRDTLTVLDAADLFAALANAMDPSRSEDFRDYWWGYAHGALVGIGMEPVSTLRVAEATMGVRVKTWDELSPALRSWAGYWDRNRSVIIQATGILMGYKRSTVKVVGAEECFVCQRRIIDGLDDANQCADGWYCGDADCAYTDHTPECKRERGNEW